MIQSAFPFVAMLLTAFTGVIEQPPQDLLSLSDVKTVLAQLQVDQSEEALMALLSKSLLPKTADTSDLDQAVKQLREGNAKERRVAQKILTSVGQEYTAYFEKLSSDSDPEVSETAKSILKKFAVNRQLAKKSGATIEVLQILAMRRLTELKSTKVLAVIKALKSSKNKDIAMEAERAAALLQGHKLGRHLRNEATQKALKMIPGNAGFVVALDLTEPAESIKLAGLLKPLDRGPLPMIIPMLVESFNKQLPGLIEKIGNPQMDSMVFVTSQQLGAEPKENWVGFIGIGKYNRQKMKSHFEKIGLEQKNINDLDCWIEGQNVTICPVSDEVIIFSIGDEGVGHMTKMLTNLNSDKAPESFKTISTASNRLIGFGQLSNKQKEMIKEALTVELARLQGANEIGRKISKSLLDLGLLCVSTKNFALSYGNKVMALKVEMDNEDNATRMVDVVSDLNRQIRALLKQVPDQNQGFFLQGLNLDNKFIEAEAVAKTVTLEVGSQIIDMLLMFSMMALPINR